MLEIINAEYRDGFNLWLEFNDGTKGIAELSDCLWGQVFEPLKDKKLFMKFKISAISNTVEWETGADLAPEFLYNKVKHR
ncbi:MAG: DUF2442 domain-containing protein [Candidatus Kapabacteria bacterium]|nr:DUF2442 domain-containing protein [Candidatus Kapabacteria bacterium]